MKCILLQEILLKSIQDSIHFISTKPQTPILGGIYFLAKENTISIRSTDLRVGFQTIVRGKVELEGECVIPGRPLVEFISCLHPGPVTIEILKGACLISQEKAKATIQTMSSSDFPPFPVVEESSISLPFDSLFSVIDDVVYAASLDETRPVLASLRIELEEKTISCVATDGYRLALSSVSQTTALDSQKILVPAKACLDVLKTLQRYKPKTVSLTISVKLQEVLFSIDEVTILLRLIDGTFPDYQPIIPNSFQLETVLLKDDLIHALKTSMVFAKENSSIVNISFMKGNCVIRSTQTTIGENEISLSSTYEEADQKSVSCNAKFLLDALSHIHSDEILFCMNDEVKPLVIKTKSSEYPFAVIMPFKR